MTPYLTFLLYLVAIVGFVGLVLSLNALLGPKPAATSTKLEPFECGATPVDTLNVKAVPIKYYAVAIVFILFDLETIFLFIWALGAQPLRQHIACARAHTLLGRRQRLASRVHIERRLCGRRLCVGHAAVHPVRWNGEVEVFGRKVAPGDLIHADKHGFIVIVPDEQPGLLEAARFMDSNECHTVIPAARDSAGRSKEEILTSLNAAIAEFSKNVKTKFQRQGEW